MAETARHLVEAAVAAHSVDPALHRIFTQEGARLGMPAIETPSDQALARESARWAERIQGKRDNAELALWMASTAVHGIIHQGLIERPHEVFTEAFTHELTELVVRFLRR